MAYGGEDPGQTHLGVDRKIQLVARELGRSLANYFADEVEDLVARTPKLCGADIAFLAANGVAIVQTGRKILAASSKFIGRHPFIEEVEFIIGRPDCGSLPREVDLDVSDYMLGLPEQLKNVLLMDFVFSQRGRSFALLGRLSRRWR